MSWCDVKDLLEYWDKEPPAHVLLAMKWLGSDKREQKTEEEMRNEMAQLGEFMGPAQPMPEYLKELIRKAEQMKKDHGGFNA